MGHVSNLHAHSIAFLGCYTCFGRFHDTNYFSHYLVQVDAIIFFGRSELASQGCVIGTPRAPKEAVLCGSIALIPIGVTAEIGWRLHWIA